MEIVRGKACAVKMHFNYSVASLYVCVCVPYNPSRKSFNQHANLIALVFRTRLELGAQQVALWLSSSSPLFLSLIPTYLFLPLHYPPHLTHFSLFATRKSHAQIWFNQFVYSAAFSMSASTMNECEYYECECQWIANVEYKQVRE